MIRRFVLLACCALPLSAAWPPEAGLQSIGPMSSFHRTGNGVLIECSDSSEVRLEVLAADLVRVRAAFAQALPEQSHSWAIARTSWTTPAWRLTENPDSLLLTTEEIEVRIRRSPLLISFADPSTHQVINADELPMAYNPRSGLVAASKKLGFDEHFYGLGEKASRIDRRRGHFTMWNTDAYGYKEGTDPIYQSIPFYMGWQNGAAYGIFYDNSYRTHFDFGATGETSAMFAAEGGPMDYYFFQGPSMMKILARYADLTGHMPMPPEWALGHQQSRYTYYPDSRVLEVADTYRKHDLPLDAIHLDIGYMNGYRLFTWDPERFPNPRALTDSLRQRGVKVVTILDPGIKVDNNYPVYEQGLAHDYFLKRKDGRVYVGKVWPGEAVFADYTSDAAALWWGGLLRAYTDNGVAGIWTDMNEPSDFIDQTGATQMDVITSDGGRQLPYAGARNLFALLMARATYEGLARLQPNQRPFVITRAGYAGIQRYSTMWTGDNTASWDSLALSIPMLASVGLSGEPFAGADVGGFAGGRPDGELLTRWYEVGFLAPFLRNHAEMGGYDHEPWRFGAQYEDIIRKYLKLRYRLLPFLYTALEQAHRTGAPLFRPLVLNFQDDYNTLAIDDEFMVGRELLAAPVLKPDQTSRLVYLPKGGWFDFWTGEYLSGGRMIRVQAPLETIPLFVRAGSVVPLGPEMDWVGQKTADPVTFEIYPDDHGEARASLFEDDGISPAYENGAFRRTSIEAHGNEVVFGRPEGTWAPAPRHFVVRLHAADRAIKSASVADNGAAQRITVQ